MMQGSPEDRERPIRLSPGSAFGSWAGASAGCLLVSWSLGPLGVTKPEVSLSAMLGAGLSAMIMLLGLLAMGPWASRTPSAWSTRWLAATVIRFITTPFLALLLYSRPPSAEGFLLSVAGTYMALLAVETAVVARGVLSAAAAVSQGIKPSPNQDPR
jgi:hypothetical protein